MSNPNKSLRLAALAAVSLCVACHDSTAPAGPPAAIHKLTAATFNVVAGSAIAGGVTVKVVDARGRGVSDSRVAFTITAERIMQDGEQITVVVNRRPSLDQFAGFVSAQATQVWHVMHEGTTWRITAGSKMNAAHP